MPKKQADLDALGAQFREAQAGVVEHRKREVAADLAVMAWERQHRGVPRHLIYDRETGDPTHPELVALETARTKATADLDWCKAVVLAAGEEFKGEPLGKILARNEAHRHLIAQHRSRD